MTTLDGSRNDETLAVFCCASKVSPYSLSPLPFYHMNLRTVYIGLGTNLADRDDWLDRGLQSLEETLVSRRAVQRMSLSPRYETEAWGMPEGTPAFLNMVVGLETKLALPELLMVVLDIERAHGRIRDGQAEGYANRTLDMDILCTDDGEKWEGESIGGSQALQVPHPRMLRRRFVLQPLLDVAPGLHVQGQSLQAALQECAPEPAVQLHRPEVP